MEARRSQGEEELPGGEGHRAESNWESKLTLQPFPRMAQGDTQTQALPPAQPRAAGSSSPLPHTGRTQ